MSDSINKVWVVLDGDGDSDWVAAVYSSEAIAMQHIDTLGGSAQEAEIRRALHPDATDPVKAAERERQAEKQRQEHARYQEHMANYARSAAAQRPQPPHMHLCHCQTFTPEPLWTEHGYCRYCGGWAPVVFKAHMGDAATLAAISELDVYDRERMLSIVGVSPVSGG